MLSLSIRKLCNTLQIVVWFTLTKHMLGFKNVFHAFTIQTSFDFHYPNSCFVYILQVDVGFQNLRIFIGFIILCFLSP